MLHGSDVLQWYQTTISKSCCRSTVPAPCKKNKSNLAFNYVCSSNIYSSCDCLDRLWGSNFSDYEKWRCSNIIFHFQFMLKSCGICSQKWLFQDSEIQEVLPPYFSTSKSFEDLQSCSNHLRETFREHIWWLLLQIQKRRWWNLVEVNQIMSTTQHRCTLCQCKSLTLN